MDQILLSRGDLGSGERGRESDPVDFTMGRCRHKQPQGAMQSGGRPGSLALVGLPWSWMFALAALERWPWPRH